MDKVYSFPLATVDGEEYARGRKEKPYRECWDRHIITEHQVEEYWQGQREKVNEVWAQLLKGNL